MSNKQEFLLEEYRQVRAELTERERTIGQLATVAIVGSITLASALLTISLSKEYVGVTNNCLFPFIFLSPLFISIPLLFVLSSHRRDLFRAGAYLQVFYEEFGFGVAWQTRIGKFRNLKPGNPLDSFAGIFRAIYFLCILLSVIYPLMSKICFSWYNWVIMIIFISMAGVLQERAIMQYKDASESHRDDCIQTWRRVRQSEDNTVVESSRIKSMFFEVFRAFSHLLNLI